MTERKSNKGCWIIKAPDRRIFIENSEIRALRKAVAMSATVTFSEWGTDIINPPIADGDDEE